MEQSKERKKHIITLEVSPFSWETEDQIGRGQWIMIRVWCHKKDNTSILIRIEDYPCSFQYEFPLTKSKWTINEAQNIHNLLNKAMKDNGKFLIPFCSKDFQQKSTLYYYNMGETKSMYHFKFMNKDACRHAKNILTKGLFVWNKPKIEGTVHEFEIDEVRKLLTDVDITHCCWFQCQARLIKKEINKISSLKEEYIVKYKTIKKIHLDIIPRPLWCDYDIEVYSHNHKVFPREWNSQDVIYNISLIFYRDGDTDDKWIEYSILMSDCIIEDKAIKDKVHLILVDTELKLLETFAEIIRINDPDLLSGYNILQFDNKYINARLERNGIDWPVIGRLKSRTGRIQNLCWSSNAYKEKDMYIPYAPGRVFLDLFEQIMRTKNWDVYTLDNAAKNILKDEPDKRKQDVEPERQFQIYKSAVKYLKNKRKNPEIEISNQPLKDMGLIVRYCIYDSRLIGYIANKIHWWIGLREMCNVVGVQPSKLLTGGQQTRVLSLLYNSCCPKNIVLDKRACLPFFYEGGAVQTPLRGYNSKVFTVDFQSLYPNIIIANNLCYTTLINPKDYDKIPDSNYNIFSPLIGDQNPDGDDFEDKDKKIIEVKSAVAAKKKAITKKDVVMYKSDFRFVKSEVKRGVLPEILANLLDQRRKVRAIKTDDPILKVVLFERQLALKVCANSVYGFTGVKFQGRMPCLEVTATTTYIGRQYVGQTADEIEKNHNCKIIYGDTDSVMCQFNDPPSPDIMHKVAQDIATETSKIFPFGLILEMENICDIFCVKPKHYAKRLYDDKGVNYVLKDGAPEIMLKGLTPVRRDTCLWVKDVIRNLISLVMEGASYHHCIKALVCSVDDLYKQKINIDNLVITKAMGAGYENENATMKVFGEEMAKVGHIINPGERHKYIVIDKPGIKSVGKKMLLLSIYENTSKKNRPTIDYDYYFHNLLLKKVDVLLAAEYDKFIEIDDLYLISRGRTITGRHPAKLLSNARKFGIRNKTFLRNSEKTYGALGARDN